MSDNLIDQLDPQRDYGSLTYEEVVAGVELGEILIQPGADLPVLRRHDGRPLKGTGRPASTQLAPDLGSTLRKIRESQQNRDWFDERMHDELEGQKIRDFLFEEAVRRIKDNEKGSSKLLEVLINQHIGKPGETTGGSMDVLAEKIIESMSKTTYIDVDHDVE